MKAYLVRACCVFLLVDVAESALCQQFSFTTWSVEQGLAQSQVTAVVQDCGGFLWAGTHGGGLSRFDGLELRSYTSFDGLVHDTVRALLVDRDCRLWIGTGAGLSLFDGAKLEPFTGSEDVSGQAIRALAQDRRGRIWLGSENGLAVYDGRRFEPVPATPSGDGAAVTVPVHSILEDRTGRIWIGTPSGLRMLDGDRPTARPLSADAPRDSVEALAEDSHGHLWIGTERGLVQFDGRSFTAVELPDPAGREARVKAVLVDRSDHLWLGTEEKGAWRFDARQWTRFSESEGLPSPTVWALAEDRESQIWLGTYRGGLVRFAGEQFVHFTARDGLGDDVVRVILNDRRGRLVFGTYRGGFSIYDGNSFTRYTRSDGLAHDFVLTVLEDRSGHLWLGTFDGVSRFDGRRFETLDTDLLNDRVVRALLEDDRGVLWIGTNQGGITLYDGENAERITTRDGLPGNAIMDLRQGPSGVVWIATSSGLGRFVPGQGIEDLSSRHPFLAGEVFSVLLDERGELWLAVFGAGVLHYAPGAPEGERFETLTHADGLRNHGVVSLVQGTDGDLWIGTENGVHRLDMTTYRQHGEKRLAYFGSSEGFRGIECVHNAVSTDQFGRLWFGTTHGATRYDPRAEPAEPVAPLVHITGIRLFLEPADLSPYARGTDPSSRGPELLVLPHHQNHVTFDFIGLSLRSPNKVSYRVRLHGFDHSWLSIGGNRHATYSNLLPGDYHFQVEARSGEGVLSIAPASIHLRIIAPLWQRTWFRVAVALAIGAAVYLAYRWRMLRHRRREAELERQVEIRTRLVERQKNELARKNVELESFTYAVSHDLRSPLFTFKGFLTMLERDLGSELPKSVQRDLGFLRSAADSMGERLAALLKLSRAGQVIAQREHIPLTELAAEVVRMLDAALRERGVRVEISSSETLVGNRARLLQVLQNLVENAIKFMGDEPRPVIRIGSRTDGRETVFYVEDNGQGVELADQGKLFELFHRIDTGVEGAGVGLALVKKIVETHGGRVWVESEGRGCGTRFLFTCPAGTNLG